MAPDDAADLLGERPPELAQEVLGIEIGLIAWILARLGG
jgi:hypothetical protein